MPFQVRPLTEVLVRPVLPAALSRLPELGINLLWSWNHSVRAVFRRLDPATWRASGFNPLVMLGRVSQETLQRAANDVRYLSLYRKAIETLDNYVKLRPESQSLIAYFSMEYGLLDCLPIYSGGLGVLSGDHLKAASDAMLPLVGVGLLYQKGYFQQRLDAGGWQQEHTPVNDFYSLPMSPVTHPNGEEMLVSVPIKGVEVFLKVWRLDVGRVKLYLLDSNLPKNDSVENREITDQLYGGDDHKRIRQEIALGIGGLRALRALGLSPTVYHMNEGHSAFLAMERIRLLMTEQGLNFEAALAASRSNNVFTTHTSVPAGIDCFDVGIVREYLEDYCRTAGIPFDALLRLARPANVNEGEPFSMAILAMQTSSFRNAVSKLHRKVSQEMWSGLWPNLPTWDVPITSVTNGVHVPTWINGDLAGLYDQYLRPDWREGHEEEGMWQQLHDIPESELWEAHRRRKRRLVAFVRERAVARALARNAPAAEVDRAKELLDPEVLTIGFARRFATYKRATLLFRDLDRLKSIVTNARMPVQIVIGGKAHPKDVPGKTLIREIVQISRDPQLAGRIVFVEDYVLDVAAEMVQGVDVWLNTPRRGEEASGTSGMKAGINGVLSLSILDGWFDEAAEETGGWAIGARDAYSPDRDDAHAAAIYSLLENEIAPLYYENRGEGIPHKWMARVKQCLENVSAKFNCQRMVTEYDALLYQPAHRDWTRVSQEGFSQARRQVEWSQRVTAAWDRIRFEPSGRGPRREIAADTPIRLEARVFLAGLTADDVRVEAVVGHVGANGELEQAETLMLSAVEKQNDVFLFGRDYLPNMTGRIGFAIRITPNHFENPLNRPCNAAVKWMGA